MKLTFRSVVVSLAVLAMAPTTRAACTPTDVCTDVGNTFVGQIEVDAVTVSWSTNSESSSVDYYRILRYDCSTPETCSTVVTTVDAVGTCNTNEEYEYEDTPPAPVGSWTYVVEVWKTDETRACAHDTEPTP